jgi:hypothetical protein
MWDELRGSLCRGHQTHWVGKGPERIDEGHSLPILFTDQLEEEINFPDSGHRYSYA